MTLDPVFSSRGVDLIAAERERQASRAEELARVVDDVLADEGYLAGGSVRWSLRELVRLAGESAAANSQSRGGGS